MDRQLYNEHIQKLRSTEFNHTSGITYLDHAGATLYSRAQLEAHLSDLTSNLYGNPHSQNPSSRLTTDKVDYIRNLVLKHFNTTPNEYDVVFTSGCTGALKLLAESFPWSGGVPASVKEKIHSRGSSPTNHAESEVVYTPDLVVNSTKVCGKTFDHWGLCNDGSSVFCYLEDNHTSVVGMREIAASLGARTMCTTEHEIVPCSTVDRMAGGRVSDSPGAGGQVSNSPGEDGRVTNSPGEDGRVTNSPGEDGQVTNSPGADGRVTNSPGADGRVTNSPGEDGRVSDGPGADGQVTLGEQTLAASCEPEEVNSFPNTPYNLFAYPAQSNFSGRKYPLSWVQKIPNGKLCVAGSCCLKGSWKVLLDAASHVSTNPLDLTKHPAHFVTLSFYKIFGFPTGLGALLVRRDCASLLHKRYYGGGTVLATISRKRFHMPREDLHDRFEDGTLPFLDIIALKHGFETLQRLGKSMELISAHTFTLARHVHHSMLRMQHGNGSPVCVLYCDSKFNDPATQGGIVNFNLLRPDGAFVGYSEVDKLACVHDIHLRTGCFCNTGACMGHLAISRERAMRNIQAGHVCGDSYDLVDGHPTGSVRISFGYMSTLEDAENFVRFIEHCFVDQSLASDPKPLQPDDQSHSLTSNLESNAQIWISMELKRQDIIQNYAAVTTGNRLSRNEKAAVPSGAVISVGDLITVRQKDGSPATVESLVLVEKLSLYPIKSCGAFKVSSWSVSTKGLLYDREWMVLSDHGSCLTQKQEPHLCLIRPSIDLTSRTMTLSAPDRSPLEIPLDDGRKRLSSYQTRVCNDRVQGLDCGEEAARWLSDILGRQCRLVRQNPDSQRKARKQPVPTDGESGSVSLSLSNEAQYLLISRSTVGEFHRVLSKKLESQQITLEDMIDRFRPNVVVSGSEPYAEEQWKEIAVGNVTLKVVGRCSRCQMICVDQLSGKRSALPLQTLLALRGNTATFGIYLAAEPR